MPSSFAGFRVFFPLHIRKSMRLFLPHAASIGICSLMLSTAQMAHCAIYGTMSNFDTYNTTPEPSEGAEIELEGCHSSMVYNTFPAHYNHMTITDYVDGANFGTRIRFEDYNFNTPVTNGSLNPNPNPASTNGHALVNTDGGEHFGFAANEQPTAMRFFWLNRTAAGQYERIGNEPLAIPNPTWSFVPANGGGAPEVIAEVKVPEPAEFHALKPDSIWMKVYKTELNRPVELDELMSGDDPGNIVPQDETEIESEWELLEGGKMKAHGGKLDDKDSKSIVRRYEFFAYTGAVDEENEPITAFLDQDLLEPPAGELGHFIAANMVAANLVAAPLLPGDFTGDGVVDGQDFLLWQTEFGANAASAGDGNLDGVVDEADLTIWSDNFGAVGAAATTAVPEPSSFGLLALALTVLCYRRKQYALESVRELG